MYQLIDFEDRSCGLYTPIARGKSLAPLIGSLSPSRIIVNAEDIEMVLSYTPKEFGDEFVGEIKLGDEYPYEVYKNTVHSISFGYNWDTGCKLTQVEPAFFRFTKNYYSAHIWCVRFFPGQPY
jgi:hypothetical protein